MLNHLGMQCIIWEHFSLNDRLYLHPDTDRYHLGEKNLDQALYNLDAFFVLAKLKLACELENRSRILSEKREAKLLSEVITMAERDFKKDNPVFEIYLSILYLLQNREEGSAFQKAKKVYSNNLYLLDQEEQRNILTVLLNCANQAAVKGTADYLQEQFDLYQLGLEFDLLIEHGRMSENMFTNIVGIGSSAK